MVVVAIGHDVQASVLTTLLLKEMGVRHIVAKAANALHGKMLEKVGADQVVFPERDMGQRIAHNLMSTNIIDYFELAPDLGIIEVDVRGNLVGKKSNGVEFAGTIRNYCDRGATQRKDFPLAEPCR